MSRSGKADDPIFLDQERSVGDGINTQSGRASQSASTAPPAQVDEEKGEASSERNRASSPTALPDDGDYYLKVIDVNFNGTISSFGSLKRDASDYPTQPRNTIRVTLDGCGDVRDYHEEPSSPFEEAGNMADVTPWADNLSHRENFYEPWGSSHLPTLRQMWRGPTFPRWYMVKAFAWHDREVPASSHHEKHASWKPFEYGSANIGWVVNRNNENQLARM
jgi:hypothetical protein